MKVIAMVKATTASEANVPPSEELMAAMGRFNEELANAGVLLAGEGLKPSVEGKRVRIPVAGGHDRRTVLDGPFAETKELVAGFWLLQVRSMDEAVQWMLRCPHPMPGEDAEIEIRPLFAEEDFAESDPTGELRAAEARLRERLAQP